MKSCPRCEPVLSSHGVQSISSVQFCPFREGGYAHNLISSSVIVLSGFPRSWKTVEISENFKIAFPRPGEKHGRFWGEFACSCVLFWSMKSHCVYRWDVVLSVVAYESHLEILKHKEETLYDKITLHVSPWYVMHWIDASESYCSEGCFSFKRFNGACCSCKLCIICLSRRSLG